MPVYSVQRQAGPIAETEPRPGLNGSTGRCSCAVGGAIRGGGPTHDDNRFRYTRGRPTRPPAGLSLQRRRGRRARRPQGATGRQRRGPRRDEQHRDPGPAWLHDHHRGLQRLLRARAALPRRPRGGRAARARRDRAPRRRELRRRREPAARLRALGRARLDARDDGHGAQPRAQRRDRRGARAALRQPALRVRLLPALRADVRRRRAGAAAGVGLRSRPVRGTARAQEAGAWRRARHGAERGRSARAGGGVQGGDSARGWASAFRTIRGSSCGARSAPSSAPGRTRAPWSTATCTATPPAGGPPSTCRRWSSATSARTAPPASSSRATRPPARRGSAASTW